MGLIYGGIPRELTGRLREQGGIRAFIETGTNEGATAAWAAGHFEQVITVEADGEIFRSAQQNLRELPNVRCLLGDSREVLRQAIRSAPRPILFWLDAHYCGGGTHHDECPLLEEIGIINAEAPDSHILIDDARCVLSPWVGVQFCTLDDLCGALGNEAHGRFMVVIEDAIVSVPAGARDAVEAHCREVTVRQWQEHDRRVNRSYNLLQRAALKLLEKIGA